MTLENAGHAAPQSAGSKSGKKNPLDVLPAENGNVAIGGDGLGYVVSNDDRTPPLYVSHFATCPGAASHRKK
jgi:hypothetical protein